MTSFSRSLFVLTFLCLLTYLLGNASVVLWDRDEPRYAQTSKQMLESGDWVVPRLLDEPREKKPAMIYWLQASAMKAVGPTVFAARLPSALFVTATIVLLAAAMRKTVGDPLAITTAAVLASNLLVIVAAKLSITDGVLLPFATLAQLSLCSILFRTGRWRDFVLFGVAQGLALLTKGPVIPAVSLLTAIAWWILGRFPRRQNANVSPVISDPRMLQPGIKPPARRWTTWAGVALAIAIAIVIFLPWWIAIEHRSPGWTTRVLHNEVINRAATPQEGHKGPPGFYFATIWGTFLPWSLLLPIALWTAWPQRNEPTVRFALAAVIGPWILFEVAATKLPHYLLPVYPALAYLVARWIIQRGRQRAAAITCLSTLVIFAILYTGIVPRIPELRLSKRLAEALLADGATKPGQEMMIDYKENSLAFYQGGTIRPESENNFLLTHPPGAWPKWLVISDAMWKRMPPNIKDQWTVLRTVHGWLYAGRDADKHWIIDVHVLRKN